MNNEAEKPMHNQSEAEESNTQSLINLSINLSLNHGVD
jgi:hypothetical protein